MKASRSARRYRTARPKRTKRGPLPRCRHARNVAIDNPSISAACVSVNALADRNLSLPSALFGEVLMCDLPARHAALETNDSLLGITRRGAPGTGAGAVLVRGADADAMPAPDGVDAWCTQRGRRSQRIAFAPLEAEECSRPRPQTDRRWRSADAGHRTNVAVRRRSCRPPCAASLRLTRRGPSAYWVGVRPTEDDGSSVGNALRMQ